MVSHQPLRKIISSLILLLRFLDFPPFRNLGGQTPKILKNRQVETARESTRQTLPVIQKDMWVVKLDHFPPHFPLVKKFQQNL